MPPAPGKALVFPTATPAPIVVWAELPTPDIAVLRTPGHVVVLADPRLPLVDVDTVLGELDAILAGPAYPLAQK